MKKRTLLLWGAALGALLIAIAAYRANRFDLEAHLKAYREVGEKIEQQRQHFASIWTNMSVNRPVLIRQAKTYLYDAITESIFYYWYGTAWDFNGTTEEPRKGKIACGYFVSNTLRHAGFQLPKYKLAQQAASIIIKSLCLPSSIKTYKSLSKLKAYADMQPMGLYIVGLDTHVGFLWKTGEELFFVHSSNSGQRQVAKELWNESRVLKRSNIFVVGNVLDNPTLIESWILQKAIPVQN